MKPFKINRSKINTRRNVRYSAGKTKREAWHFWISDYGLTLPTLFVNVTSSAINVDSAPLANLAARTYWHRNHLQSTKEVNDERAKMSKRENSGYKSLQHVSFSYLKLFKRIKGALKNGSSGPSFNKDSCPFSIKRNTRDLQICYGQC